jgi:hypothetical protein
VHLLGVRELNDHVRTIEHEFDVASRELVVMMQSRAKAKIKSKMRGAPKWNERGKSAIYSAPHFVTDDHVQKRLGRGGGNVGKFSGALLDSVVASSRRRIHVIGGEARGRVWVTNKRHRQVNIYSHKMEARYGFFAAGMASAAVEWSRLANVMYEAALKRAKVV